MSLESIPGSPAVPNIIINESDHIENPDDILKIERENFFNYINIKESFIKQQMELEIPDISMTTLNLNGLGLKHIPQELVYYFLGLKNLDLRNNDIDHAILLSFFSKKEMTIAVDQSIHSKIILDKEFANQIFEDDFLCNFISDNIPSKKLILENDSFTWIDINPNWQKV